MVCNSSGAIYHNAKRHLGKYCVLHRTRRCWKRKEKLLSNCYGLYENYTGLQKFYRFVQIELWKSKRCRDQTNWLTWNKYLKDKSDGVSKDIFK